MISHQMPRRRVRPASWAVGALALLVAPASAQQGASVVSGMPSASELRSRDGEFFLASQLTFPRVHVAKREKQQVLRDRFARLGIPYPPAGLYLRVFKVERVVEVWVRPQGRDDYVLFTQYPVCAVSGWLGPKRGQGDLQIPEGFYRVEGFNPHSEYFLSLRVDYPNVVDRRAGMNGRLGGDIYLHGGCETVGCVPITDEHIKELYWLAAEVRGNGGGVIPVHIFPTRLDEAGMEWLGGFFGHDSGLMGFWEEMRAGYDWFQRRRRVPGVGMDGAGRYVIGDPSKLPAGVALLGTPAAAAAAKAAVGKRRKAAPEVQLLGSPAPDEVLSALVGGAAEDTASLAPAVTPRAAVTAPETRAEAAAAPPVAATAVVAVADSVAAQPAAATTMAGVAAPSDADSVQARQAAAEAPGGVGLLGAPADPALAPPPPGSARAASAAGARRPTGGEAGSAVLGSPVEAGAVPRGGAAGEADPGEAEEPGPPPTRLLGKPHLLGQATSGVADLEGPVLIQAEQMDGAAPHGIPRRIRIARVVW